MLLRLCALIGLVFLSACATITTSPSQNLTVLTEPPGASCEIQRNSRHVAVVSPTPGTARIGKSVHDTTVTCTREAHLPAQATLTPEFQPVTLGNILIGGVVGLVVDVSTGAVSKYPETVQVTLIPASFPSPEDKAAYFAQRALEIRRATDLHLASIRQGCQGSDCDTRVAEAEAQRDRFLVQLEERRQQTL
ncbi:hypothetical protein J8J14_06130 [Roseomonas sp. SSH11]|uniref:Lipoprotein n=1 Tax=Pararoseomonas baculiformis TaxID=2820812 RepID=A0ABS4ACW5_9PROT|nr:hypothetical protein [Pararoseomonas baculiformis]MBP0444353.1 hypothetical protein [Pararoseomonas baculiformis]